MTSIAPDPLRVQRERLRERGRDEQLDARPDELQQPGRVLAQAVAEPLVGEVDQRQHAPLLDEVADPPPQVGRRVHAGRVVARAVEQHDIAGRGAPQRGEHRRLVDPAPGRVGVRVGPDAEPRRLEHRGVVGPGRLAEPDRLAAAGGPDEVGRDAQPAGAARGLGRERPAGRHGLVVRAEDERPHELPVRDLAVDRAVELRARGRRQASLGLDHRVEDRRRARLVDEHARRQVDLPGARVGAVRIGQAEDRVRRGGDAGERRQRHGWTSGGRAGRPATPPTTLPARRRRGRATIEPRPRPTGRL